MPYEYLMMFSIIAFVNAVIFLFHGQKLLRLKFFANYLGALLFVCLAVILFPKNIVLKWVQFVSAFIVSLFAVSILFNFIYDAIWKVGEFFSRTLPGYLSEICLALEFLASRKVGALVVIRRKDDFEEFISGGFAFDAEVKSEILSALFEKDSLVHDGAVIINDGRIARVRAVLPLSLDESIPVNVGTRHRSAIGISERTDALILVVSEERGEISVVYQGSLVKPASQDELLKLLKKIIKRG